MSRYHLAHIIPDPRFHGFKGFQEVIDTVAWGLERLGHRTTRAVNAFARDATNIIFGAQMLPVEAQKALSADTIVYNFDPLRNLSLRDHDVKPEVMHYAANFRIWDYTAANSDAWKALSPKYEVRVVPVGFAPLLSRIVKPSVQDIDVLIYGTTGQERLQVFHEMAHRGVTAVYLCGLYGAARDELIARSKIVLNVNYCNYAKIFEVVRVSYLLANRKAVVADESADTFVDPDIRPGVRFAPLSGVVDACRHLIDTEKERIELEEAGHAAIQQRDIVKILTAALS
jgi:hypothetical protein